MKKQNSKENPYSYFIPEKKKGRKYHKDKHDLFLQSGMLSSGIVSQMQNNWDWYLGTFDMYDVHRNVLVDNEGNPFPIDPINSNAILGAIHHKIGRIHRRKSRVTARAISPDAIGRKEDGRMDIEADFRMLPFDMRAQDATGVPLISQNRPKTREEADEAIMNYREKGEDTYDRLIRHHYAESEMDHVKLLLYEKVQVLGIAHVHIHSNRGYPEVKSIPPEMVLVDSDATDPHFTDAKFVVIMEYKPIQDIATEFSLDEEDRKKIDDYDRGNSRLGGGFSTGSIIGGLPGTQAIKKIGSVQHALVTTCYWYDIEKRRLIEESRNGFNHTQDEEDTKPPKKGRKVIERYDREHVRYCTVIAGDIVPHDGYGKLENAYREYGENWMKTRLPVVSWAPNWKNGKLTSTVQQIWPLQVRIDRFWMMLDRAMRNDRGKIVANDVSQTPDFMTPEQQMATAEVQGYFPYNGSDYTTPGNYRQLISLDLSMPPGVQLYRDLAIFAQQQIDRIVGLTESEKGEANVPGQKAGTVRSSIEQSSVRHRYEASGFDRFMARIYEQVIDKFRLIIRDRPDRYTHIIGQDSLAWLQEHGSFDTEDYGIDIEADDLDRDRIASVQGLIDRAIQVNPSLLPEGLSMVIEDDYRSSIRKLSSLLKKQEFKMEQAQRTQAMMSQQAQQAQQQMRSQEIQAQREADMQKVQMMEELRAMREERVKAQEFQYRAAINQIEGQRALQEARMKEAGEDRRLNKEMDMREESNRMQAQTQLEIARMNRQRRG